MRESGVLMLFENRYNKQLDCLSISVGEAFS